MNFGFTILLGSKYIQILSALAGCIEDEEERSDTWSPNYCDSRLRCSL